MRTNSDNHKAISDYADTFYGPFLGNEKTRDAATQIIESLKYSEEVIKEIDEHIASLKDGNRSVSSLCKAGTWAHSPIDKD